MSTDSSGSLKIAWWNTGIAPPVRGKVPKVPSESLQAGIVRLCSECDLTFLGEYKNVPSISDRLTLDSKNTIDWRPFPEPEGRICFNMAMFFRTNRIQPDGFCMTNLTTGRSDGQGRKYRIAQRLSIQSSFFQEKLLIIYVIHWGQYGNNEQNSRLRDTVIPCIKADINEIASEGNPYIMLLGDFNIEPYCDHFSHLGASRDLEYVKKEKDPKDSFYNPFWQYMQSEGTINFPNRDSLKCYTPTFDQVLLHKNFVLSPFDFRTKIISDYCVPKRGEHFPILLEIQSRRKQ